MYPSGKPRERSKTKVIHHITTLKRRKNELFCTTQNHRPKHATQTLRRASTLGATSGRTILGSLRDGELVLKERTRFPNTILPLGGHYYWNIFSLYEHPLRGTARRRPRRGRNRLGRHRHLGRRFRLRRQVTARCWDPPTPTATRTPTAPPRSISPRCCPGRRVYGATGIQIMQFNLLYQLYAMQRDRSSQLAAADGSCSSCPTLTVKSAHHWGDGHRIHHRPTSQLLNPRTKRTKRLLAKMGLSPELFPRS